MTILLIFCVLAAAGWLVLSVNGRDSSDDPGNSIEAYSRAMAALDPTAGQPRRRPAPTSARPRATARPSTRGAVRTTSSSSSRRRATAPAPRRAVRR